MPVESASNPRPDAVADDLRTAILAGEFGPGSALTESGIAVRFGIARPTARIAIDKLVAEGLLRREAHHTARVPELDRYDIADLFDSRAIIEGAALAALARDGTIPADALAAHRELRRRSIDDEPYAAADIAFHCTLVTGQPSARLARMHGLLMGEIELGIAQVDAHRLRSAAEVVRDHQGILDAVTAGDAELAERLTREHIIASRDRLLAHYDSTRGIASREDR